MQGEVHIFESLIDRCIQRDERARKELYDLFSAQMFSVCLRYAKNRSQAEDIFQDAFVKVFEHLPKLTNKSHFPGWIKRVFVNTAIDSIRANNKYNTNENIQIIEHFADVQPSIIDDMAHEDLLDLIQSLPPRAKIVFNMFVMEGYSHQEIADELGISVGTSKSHLFDAKNILKTKLLVQESKLFSIVC
ncbi:MAG: RNA polymerase sigma factor [Crocinitomicaceae bacterium]|jgi:RNA polymerase sigma-70 factor (ECF subfamily)